MCLAYFLHYPPQTPRRAVFLRANGKQRVTLCPQGTVGAGQMILRSHFSVTVIHKWPTQALESRTTWLNNWSRSNSIHQTKFKIGRKWNSVLPRGWKAGASFCAIGSPCAAFCQDRLNLVWLQVHSSCCCLEGLQTSSIVLDDCISCLRGACLHFCRNDSFSWDVENLMCFYGSKGLGFFPFTYYDSCVFFRLWMILNHVLVGSDSQFGV